ncbi:MAG: XRE family transcriptional regulator [Robiginitomaculum sp.]|nr:MAG: XRE family transcriptional regulator [Robiginitomaculum sp.]
MSRQKRKKDAQCDAVGAHFGQTVSRLRQAGKLSLGDLSEQSGVAKSMISQIEKNESNPTLATITRLSRALGTSVESILTTNTSGTALVQKSNRQDIPLIESEDGLCTLRIIGWMATVEYVQWYDFSAQVGGTLESSAHPNGSVENLSVLEGELEVQVGGETWAVKAGETLRYRADETHSVTNIGTVPARATMVNILALTPNLDTNYHI